jgi:hypothetical protein
MIENEQSNTNDLLKHFSFDSTSVVLVIFCELYSSDSATEYAVTNQLTALSTVLPEKLIS